MTHDPIRLLDDPSAHAALRRDLAAAARHRVPYDAAAGAARLEASLSKGTGAASSGWSGSALGVGALILGGLISAGAWLSAGASPEAERPAARGPAGAAVEAPVLTAAPVRAAPVLTAPVIEAPAVASAAVPEDMAEDAADPAGPPTPSKAAAKPKVRSGGAAVKKDPPAAGSAGAIAGGADYLREAKSLQAARGLLGRDPAQALARAQAGAAEFPKGAFSQEWEGVELLALFELGRRAEAEPRATRYLDRFPKGPYAAQIREALARP